MVPAPCGCPGRKEREEERGYFHNHNFSSPMGLAVAVPRLYHCSCTLPRARGRGRCWEGRSFCPIPAPKARPCVPQASLPVQEYLFMPFDQAHKQYETARHLPPPLYVLFVQASAYGQACGEHRGHLGLDFRGNSALGSFGVLRDVLPCSAEPGGSALRQRHLKLCWLSSVGQNCWRSCLPTSAPVLSTTPRSAGIKAVRWWCTSPPPRVEAACGAP